MKKNLPQCSAWVQQSKGATIQGIGQYKTVQCSRHATEQAVRVKDGTALPFCATHKRMALAGTVSAEGAVHSAADRNNFSRFNIQPWDAGVWIEAPKSGSILTE